MKSILDSSFQYTSSFNTDLEKTFARIRCAHQKGGEEAAQPQARQPRQAIEIRPVEFGMPTPLFHRSSEL